MKTINYKGQEVRVHKRRGVLGTRCSSCKKHLSFEKFGIKLRSNGKYYLESHCLPCRNEKSKVWRKNNLAGRLYKSARGRASEKGREFAISLEDVKVPIVCPILGIPIIDTTPKQTPNSPSIDRIDNSKGYTKNNIVVCSLRANILKADMTLNEAESIYKFMRKHENVSS